MMDTIHNLNKKSEKGFTLIELMIVVAIIGILAAIAIPQFAAYREKAFCETAEADLRNMMTAEEAYFASYFKYFTAAGIKGPSSDKNLGYSVSKDVTISAAIAATTDYTITSSHAQCTKGSYTVTGGTGIIRKP